MKTENFEIKKSKEWLEGMERLKQKHDLKKVNCTNCRSFENEENIGVGYCGQDGTQDIGCENICPDYCKNN